MNCTAKNRMHADTTDRGSCVQNEPHARLRMVPALLPSVSPDTGRSLPPAGPSGPAADAVTVSWRSNARVYACRGTRYVLCRFWSLQVARRGAPHCHAASSAGTEI